MAKSFMESIQKGNSYKPRMGGASPVPVDVNKLESLIDTKISSEATNMPHEDNYSTLEVDEIEEILDENSEVIEKLNLRIDALEEELSNKQNEILKLEKKISTLSRKSKNKLSIHDLLSNSDLPENAKKIIRAVYSYNSDDWIHISKPKMLDDFKVHRNEYTKGRNEAVESGLIDFKMDCINNSKRKGCFYKALK